MRSLETGNKHYSTALYAIAVSRLYAMKIIALRYKPLLIAFILIAIVPGVSFSQNNQKQDSTQVLTLDQCIAYALQNQPGLNQSLLNESIARTTNSINLSGWLPQVNVSGSLIHYVVLPTTLVTNTVTPGGEPIATRTGTANVAIPELTISQTIFNPQLLYAARSAPLYVQQAQEATDSSKIGIVVSVSKSFYNLLQTLAQIDVLKDDTARLGRSAADAYHQYKGGIVDITDYQEAVITLNNSKAQLFQQLQNVVPEYAALKEVMGYAPEKHFNIAFDTVQMRQQIAFDTTQALQYEKRIEYQELQTNKSIQQQLTSYYDLAFLPTVSAFYDYNYEFESDQFSTLFSQAYPYSYLGLSINIPIFTGFSRLENIHKSRLQEQLLDWREVSLKSQIYTEYTTALANYKSNIYSWKMMKDNEEQARNVYRVVSLQYKQGIVAYLNMIVAESNLISSEIGYINALFQVLASKIDLQKSIGAIPYNSSTQKK